MTKCDEPACFAAKTETQINCSSPFCQRKFHLSCANLKGTRKSEINTIYFICNVCLEFIKYSNSYLETKLSNLEGKLGGLIEPIGKRLENIEIEFQKTIKTLSDRIDIIEKSQSAHYKSNSASFEKIDVLHQKVNCEIDELRVEMSEFDKKIKSLNEQLKSVNAGCETHSLNQPVQNYPSQSSDQYPDLKYEVRVFGVEEAPENMDKAQRYSYDLDEINKITNHCGIGNALLRNAFRIGKFVNKTAKPRPILLHFQSVWDVRRLFSSVHKLKTYASRIFISPALSQQDRLLEKALLRRRHELISNGTNRRDVKVKGLKLFVNDKEIDYRNT